MTRRFRVGFAVVTALSVLAAGLALAQVRPPAGGSILGAADFRPTPDRPIGWRGDATGRYPGATPPLEWSRRVKGITTEIKYQADKPAAGAPGAGAHPLEYFTLNEWLVIGPFDAADPKNIEAEALPNEAAAEPRANDKVGELAWKHLRVAIDSQSSHVHNEGICRNLNVDFVYAFGKFSEVTDPKQDWAGAHTKIDGDFANKLAYAHTYIYSPAAGTAGLNVAFSGAAIKAYFNGKPVKLNMDPWNYKPAQVELAQGWNHLLIKASTANALRSSGGNATQSNWRFAAYLTPPSGAPVAYETKNIAWMTRVTGRSMSNPVVVGDSIFVGSGISDLMCIQKADGKIRWIRSNTPWNALKPEEQAQYKEQVGGLVEQLNAANDATVAAINAMVSPTGMNSAQQVELDKKLRDKRELENKIHTAFHKIDSKRFPPLTGNEVSASNATPCTDGARVYWACGGGMKGTGASVISCYDLAGKHVWSFHEALGAAEHGLHTSPILVGGKLIYAAPKTLLAFDALTGKALWRTPTEEFCGNTIQATRIGNEPVIVSHHVGVFRASDGKVLGAQRLGSFGDTTPVIEDGVLYHSAKFKNWGNYNIAFAAVPLPTQPVEKAKFPDGWELSAKDVYMPLKGINYIVASPLYVNGIVYNMDMTGGLAAVDVKSHKPLYRLWLDWYARYDRYLYGAVASPTLGGKNIYCVDDSGCTIVFAPGAEFKQLARNLIENVHLSGEGGNPCRIESFYSSPVFEGNSIYLKGEEYLYAIRKP